MGIINWSCQTWMDIHQRHEADGSPRGKEPSPGHSPRPLPQFTPSPTAGTHPESQTAPEAPVYAMHGARCAGKWRGKLGENQGAALLGAGTQKGAASSPPPPSLSLGDRIQPWGMCSCLCRGLAPGTPSAPTPEAGTEHPVPQPLRVSPARLSLQAASSTAG